MKRIALYTFYEKNGEVRNFVTYFLKSLAEVCETIVVIVNGVLSSEGRKRLNKCGVKILVRNNEGFDFSAWKAGIEYIGWDFARAYDEIVLCNCAVYGPIYPFVKIFDGMNKTECDFWGLYRHPEIKKFNIPAHLQSYFIVFRRSIINDISFYKYFNELNVAHTWKDANFQEMHFTEYFEKSGFKSSSFIDNSLDGLAQDPSIRAPVELFNKGFPLIKRKVFYENYEEFLSYSPGMQARETIEFLASTGSYDPNLIIEDMLHTTQMSILMNSLHLNYIFNPTLSFNEKKSKKSLALIIYSYFEDMVDCDCKYIRNLPVEADVYIVVVSRKMALRWHHVKASIPQITEIRIQENRGRNEAASWITCKDVINSHNFICVVHDKKSLSVEWGMIGNRWNRHCWDNLLASETYIENILSVFEKYPKIGILIPPIPFFGPFRIGIPLREWLGNKKLASKLYKRLNLSIPFDESPYAPWGAMFWFRSEAIQPLFRHDWKIVDFPEEPLKVADGTILHALERMYPMIAQEAGFLTGTIMTDSYAGDYFDNLLFEYKKHLSHENALSYEIGCLKHSRSFRLGRMLTWFPRKIRDRFLKKN